MAENMQAECASSRRRDLISVSLTIVNVKMNLTFTIIILFILPCTSDDCVISVQIGTGKRNLFIAFTINYFGTSYLQEKT